MGKFAKLTLITTYIVLIAIIGAMNVIIISAASGQCYPGKATYQYGEIITIILNTPTGINNTKIVVYLPNGQITTLNIGKIGIGIWQFPLGPAAPPEGRRMVMLMDGSTILFTSYYDVIEAAVPPAPEVTVLTVTEYRIQTTTISSFATVTQYVTEERTEKATETFLYTVTIERAPPVNVIHASSLVIASLAIIVILLMVKISREKLP